MCDEQIWSGGLVNGDQVSLGYKLQQGDEIAISPTGSRNGAYRGKLGAADEGCMMVSAESAARLFDISVRSWWRMNAAGEVPASVVVGARSVRWDVAKLKAWHQAGRPTRAKWEVLKTRVGA